MRDTALQMLQKRPQVLYLLSQYKLRLQELEAPRRAHRDIPYATRIMGVLDYSVGDASEGDQSAGETQAPMPVVVQNQQIQTRRQGGGGCFKISRF